MFNPNDDSSLFLYTLIYLFKNPHFQSTVSHNAHQQHWFAPFQNFLFLLQLPPYLSIILHPKSSVFTLSEDKKSQSQIAAHLWCNYSSGKRRGVVLQTLRSPGNLTTLVSQYYYRYDIENQTFANKRAFTKSLSAIHFRDFNITFEVTEIICWKIFKINVAVFYKTTTVKLFIFRDMWV